MTRFMVANTSDIPPGERLIVELEGRSVGIFNIAGEFHALLNRCPHAGAPLCEYGTIFGISTAETPDTEITYEPQRSLRCPWHGWEFDLRTGASFYDPHNARVRRYNVEVVPGAPEVETDPARGRQEGPLILEGYAVSVEDDVVVVDTSRRRAGGRRSRAGSTGASAGA